MLSFFFTRVVLGEFGILGCWFLGFLGVFYFISFVSGVTVEFRRLV